MPRPWSVAAGHSTRWHGPGGSTGKARPNCSSLKETSGPQQDSEMKTAPANAPSSSDASSAYNVPMRPTPGSRSTGIKWRQRQQTLDKLPKKKRVGTRRQPQEHSLRIDLPTRFCPASRRVE